MKKDAIVLQGFSFLLLVLLTAMTPPAGEFRPSSTIEPQDVPAGLRVEWERGWNNTVAPEYREAEFIWLLPASVAGIEEGFVVRTGRFVSIPPEEQKETKENREPVIASSRVVTAEECRSLFALILESGVLELEDHYSEDVEGGSEESLYISFDGTEKKIEIYGAGRVEVSRIAVELQKLAASDSGEKEK